MGFFDQTKYEKKRRKNIAIRLEAISIRKRGKNKVIFHIEDGALDEWNKAQIRQVGSGRPEADAEG